ncbi:MAG: hypothetical protein PHW35_13490 [Lentimicrobiaceae bacterium]|jgi:hypothetical protein|nr:hypothetical protein [Lentimicrobiaceae bacterium]MDD4598973.1 hypothetical protein [Lentimicrobiaceae bacterium]
MKKNGQISIKLYLHLIIVLVFILIITSCNSLKHSKGISRMEYISLNAACPQNTITNNDTCQLLISIINQSDAIITIDNIYSASLRHARNNNEIFGDHRSIELSMKKELIILYPNIPTELYIDVIGSTDFFVSGLNSVSVVLFYLSGYNNYVAFSNYIEIYFKEE